MSDLVKTCRVCGCEKVHSEFRERMLRGAKMRIGKCRTCESEARTSSAVNLSPDDVRRLFHYNSVTGEIRWRKRENEPKFKLVGHIAGTRRRDGRGVIVYKNGFFLSSRIAWAYMTGEWPAQLVDHADNDPSNDAWSNLRAANKTQNGFNKRRKSMSSSCFKGVYYATYARKWRSEIRAGAERRHLGYFDSEAEAAKAYAAAAHELHGEFARLS